MISRAWMRACPVHRVHSCTGGYSEIAFHDAHGDYFHRYRTGKFRVSSISGATRMNYPQSGYATDSVRNKPNFVDFVNTPSSIRRNDRPSSITCLRLLRCKLEKWLLQTPLSVFISSRVAISFLRNYNIHRTYHSCIIVE